ncbi:hypothetical protein Tco_0880181, partial [Tanacetum coccineum]
MSSASSAVTYTSVYTDSEPGRVFWGADDEEITDGGIPQVIVYGYDGLPMQPVAPPSPDYIPGPEDPQTPPDEHEFPAEEQPLPLVSPTAESPGYVVESDPEEDPEEYEDDETEDGDEDDEDEEEENEHLASADSAVVVPTVELVSPPEGTEPVIPPPSTNISTTGARITVRLQASISLPRQREHPARIASTQALVDAVTVALPSPPLPPLPPSLCIPPPADRRDDIPEFERPPHKRPCFFALGSKYEVGESSTTRPTGCQGIDYGFVSTLDAEERRRGIRKVRYGIRDTWVDSAEAVPEIAHMTLGEVNTRVTELAELHEHDTQDLYALLEDAQDSRTRISQRETVLIVEEEAYASREAWAHSIGLSQAVHHELQTHREQVYAHESQLHAHQTQLQLQGTLIQTQHQVHETRSQMQQAEMTELQETDRRCQAQIVETLRVMRDMRREMGDMQAELLALRGQRIMAPVTRRGPNTPPNNTNQNNITPGAVQAMIDQAFLPNSTNGDGSHRAAGVVGLTRWIEKMESVFNISGCAIENQVKFATCTMLGAALTWWNGQIRTLGPEAYSMTWEVLKKKMTDKYCPQGEIKKL